MGRTKQELYGLWRALGEGGTFEGYFQHRWEEMIRQCESLGFVLNPCPRRQKYYCVGLDLYGETVPHEIIVWHVRTGGNLGVITGPSGIVVLGFESKDVPAKLVEMMGQAPCVDTPSGFSFFLRAPFDYDLFDQLRLVFPAFSVPKTDGLIELVPLSESCAIPGHGMSGAPCPPHQYRLWEWVGRGLDLPMPTFADFVKRVV